jgi:hypothetical protein
MRRTFHIEIDVDLGYQADEIYMRLIEVTVIAAAEESLRRLQLDDTGNTEPVLICCTAVEATHRCEGCDQLLDPEGPCPLDAAARANPDLLGCGQGGYEQLDLTDDERHALEGDRDAVAALVDKLADVPTPAGPTPKQLGTEPVFVALTTTRDSRSRESS